MLDYKNFIDIEKIKSYLEGAKGKDPKTFQEILEQARNLGGLSIEQVAILLQNTDPEIDEEIFRIAKEVKRKVYGNRMVLFAPLYISNSCINNCVYCGFRVTNRDLKRKVLTYDEITQEVSTIEQMGHKRLLMVFGEGNHNINWVKQTIKTAYAVKGPNSDEIRRINVNMAPMSVEDFKVLKSAEIGTYQCFQETYHLPTYKKMHLSGPKANYLYRLYAMHRAMEAGIDDVGMGVLYGLYDYKFETLALLKHCQELEKEFNVGPHTLSFPRIEPAPGSSLSYNPPHPINDHEFKKIIAITRLAIPHTGIIISTRENAALRKELLHLGVSQLSAASKVSPGSYTETAKNSEQFQVSDERSLDEVILDMVKNNFLPSFCTGCYRKERTGEHFMELAKTTAIKDCCTPNAIFSFAEYLRDYASDETQKTGTELINKMLEKNKKLRPVVASSLSSIKRGENDIYL